MTATHLYRNGITRRYTEWGRRRNPAGILGVAAVVWLGAMAFGVGAADAAPSTSLNVAIIGSPSSQNGGALTTSGTGPTGSFSAYNFTNLAPASVSAASLAPFDTVVLNVASPEMNCSTGTLSAAQKTALNNFVGSGHKMILYASECLNTDFTWLPFTFQSNNPGAQGATGTLKIVEENDLSSNTSTSPRFIDAVMLSTQTDAVGDANVFTTNAPEWRVDMTALNVNQITGPVHTYADYTSPTPGNTNRGLFIYNGLDIDYEQSSATPDASTGSNNMSKIFLQELQQVFNPDNLPGSVAVVGITLNPQTATNPVGTSHTVTANVTNSGGTAQPNTLVTFTVVSGPNSGRSGTCAPATCKTGASGNVTFTYSGTGGAGTDAIKACFTNSSSQSVCSQTVTKTWTADTTPPSCVVTAVRRAGPGIPKDQQDVTVQDNDSGLKSITNVQITNGTVGVPPFTVGTKSPVVVTATKTTQGVTTRWSFDATDVAGNVRHCG